MTRIRYSKISKSTIKSNDILIGEQTYVVKITGKYYCIQTDQGIVFSMYCSSTRACKSHAKQMLRKIGAVFQDEIRRRLT